MSVTVGVITTVNVSEIDALITRLEAVPLIIAKYANLVFESAVRLVPVDTGALRASIHVVLELWAADIIAGEGLDYARAQEYGTHLQPGTAFLRPSFERYAAAFFQEISAVFGG